MCKVKCGTARRRIRYAVALPDRDQAIILLARLLEARTDMHFAAVGPVPDPMYYRLGLTPGMALRLREPSESC
jgi:hypothetical protein